MLAQHWPWRVLRNIEPCADDQDCQWSSRYKELTGFVAEFMPVWLEINLDSSKRHKNMSSRTAEFTVYMKHSSREYKQLVDSNRRCL